MRDYDDKLPWWLCILAFLAGLVIGAYGQHEIAAEAVTERMQSKAIEHGAARYHPETGEFQWTGGEDEK